MRRLDDRGGGQGGRERGMHRLERIETVSFSYLSLVVYFSVDRDMVVITSDRTMLRVRVKQTQRLSFGHKSEGLSSFKLAL